jgi:hypothetical protein
MDTIEVIMVRQSNATGAILGIVIICPLCNAQISCNPRQIAGHDSIRCPTDCGFDKRVDIYGSV